MTAPNVEDVYGLCPLQFGMLFHSLHDSGGISPYLVQMTEEITGPFEDKHFLDAWQQVVDRHSILRSAFLWEGVSMPVQVVQRTAKLPCETFDWRDCDAAEHEARLQSLSARDWEQGFDLTVPPLLRVKVIRVAEERRLILWSFHHILVDGWSIQLIKKELFAIYRAAIEGKTADLPPALPYLRYAQWLHEQPMSDAQRFWRSYLRGISEPTSLAVDRPTGESGVADIEISFDLELSHAVRRFARSHSITVHTLIQGIWSVLLSRYSGNEDVVFGSTTSGRSIPLPGIESMVGMFINTLPVRARVDRLATLGSWLQDLQAQQVELRQWEHCSLVDIHGDSDIPRGKPLFRSILVFENYPDLRDSSDLPEGVRHRVIGCMERTGYPLTVVASCGELLEVRFAYDRASFDGATIDRLVRHFRNLLVRFLANPSSRIGDVEMLSEEELAQFARWNDTVGEFPSQSTLDGLVSGVAQGIPDAVAVRCGPREMAFGQLEAAANRLAWWLHDQHIGRGDLIGVCLPHGIEVLVAVLGILKAGAAYVPLDPDYPVDRLAYMLADTQAPLVITDQHSAHTLPEHTPRLLLDHHEHPWRSCPTTPVPVSAGPHDLAYVIYTSGSTGQPKGVLIEHHGVVNYLTWCHHHYPPTGPTGTLLYSSLAFDLTVTALFLPLLQGLPIHIPQPPPGETPFTATVEHLLAGHPVSFLKLTPSHLDLLLTAAETTHTRLHIHSLVVGGEELSAELTRRALTAIPGTVIFNEYGATECSVANVIATITDPPEHTGGMPVGSPITNTHAMVVDEHLQPVPIGVPGQCLLGGVCTARGYHHQPHLTSQRFTPTTLAGHTQTWYHTGDLCRWLPNGQLQFLGRIDNQIKLHGYRIEPGEIETTLTRHPAIHTATIIVRHDTSHTPQLVAYLTTTPGTTPPTPHQLKQHAAQTLPTYMIPTHYITLPTLPLTPNGKIDHTQLPPPPTTQPTTHTPPTTPTEHLITTIWQDILNTHPINTHDNFFDLGGHSLRAVKVVSRIRNAGYPVVLQQIMQHPTVAELAKELDSAARRTSSLIADVGTQPAGPDLPTLFCVHPGGGQIHSYQALARELRGVFRVLGVRAAGWAEGEAPLETVRAMAERYWDEIKAVQPQGKYHILGWSTGAVVVHEMAAMHPGEIASAVLLEPAITCAQRQNRFDDLASIFARAESLWHRGQAQVGAAREQTRNELKPLASLMNLERDAVDLDVWLPYNVLRAEARALADYRAGQSHSPATLFVSDEIYRPGQDLMATGSREEYIAHWKRLYPKGLRVIDLSGGHHDILSAKESITTIASCLYPITTFVTGPSRAAPAGE